MGVGLWATLTLLTALGHAWAKRVGKKKGKIMVLGSPRKQMVFRVLPLYGHI